MQRVVSGFMLVLLVAPAILLSQPPVSVPESAKPAPAEKLIAFDVASVRLEKEGHGGPIHFTPDGFVCDAAPLEYLIRYAYHNYHDGFVTHQPDWAATDYYVVEAKVADSDVPTWKTYHADQQRRVLQHFLADRFHLVVHPDIVERPVYSLVVAKAGLKMKPVTPPEGDSHGFIELKVPGVEVGHHATMSLLVDSLLARSSFGLDRQVFDNTGLTGNYDFTLSHEPLRSSRPSDASSSSEESERPSIFTALQEQLGLKLEPAKAQVPILVVDHVERPSEN